MFEQTQIRLLEAMGYRLLQRPSAVEPGAVPATTGSAASESMPAAESPTAVPAPAVQSPADRLWAALLAAAALTPERADANGLRRASSGVAFEYIADELWVDPEALRRNPQGKRGLWKALRGLRRLELGRGG
jgi:hypothetical protein